MEPLVREFEVVFVCTGNRFRSPIAECLLRAATRGLPVRVHSLGTLQVDSPPPVPEAIDLSQTLSLDLSEHRSRCLDGLDLGGADLVIGFELNHIARAVIDGIHLREEEVLLDRCGSRARDVSGRTTTKSSSPKRAHTS